MSRTERWIRSTVSAILLALLAAFPILGIAQDLVTVSSLTGGSSVFIFRASSRSTRPIASAARPNRTKSQRKATVDRIKGQYETLAKTETRRTRAPEYDPRRLPPNARTLPAAEGAKIFAGVGEYYLNRSEFDNAMQFFRDAVSLDETNKAANEGLSESLARKGNLLLVDDKFETAKAIFLEALKYDPLNSAANFGLGEVYSELDLTADAIASYEKSLKSDGNLTEIYVPLGILYYQTGEIARADDLLTKALATNADSAETQFFLGLVRASQNRYDESLKAFEKAKTLDPKYPEAFYHSADILAKQKRHDAAIPDYLTAVELKPAYLEAWTGLGEAYFATKQFDEAVKAFKSARKLKNDSWEIFAALGDAEREAGSFNDAAGSYNLAKLFLVRDPAHSTASLADLHSKIGFSIGQQCDIDTARSVACRWGSAIKELEAAAAITNNPVDHVNVGWAYFRAAHPEAELKNMAAAMPNLILAKGALEKALAGPPEVVQYALQNLAAVQIDMGDQTGAISTLQKLIQARPDENYLRYQLGVAYFKNNDFAGSERAFRDALDKDPNYLFALTGLGEALIGRKNGKEVRKVIDRLRPIDRNAADRLELKLKVSRL